MYLFLNLFIHIFVEGRVAYEKKYKKEFSLKVAKPSEQLYKDFDWIQKDIAILHQFLELQDEWH